MGDDLKFPSAGKIVLWIFIVIIGLFAIDFVGNTYGLFSYGFFAPKKENIRRHVFENTQSYVQGKIQDLSNYKLQMDTTKDPASKAAIQAVIRSQFANFDINQCPDELKAFLQAERGY
jgi:hypothetical protein